MKLSQRRSRGLPRGPFVIALAMVSLFSGSLVAQTDSIIRYPAQALACLAFHQSVLSDLETVHGDDLRTESVGWEGDIVLRTDADTGAVASVTAWFERLRVWRDIPEGRLEPATDGMLGGRYRGTLSHHGSYRALAAPFVPDAVSAIAAMETALDELFPPLPAAPLAEGGTLTDERGWGFDRLSDTLTAGGTAWRLRLVRTDTAAVSVDWGSGQASEGQSVEVERGRLVWQPGVGPVSWVRRITTVVTFLATTVSARAVRTEVRQERRLERLDAVAPDSCGLP